MRHQSEFLDSKLLDKTLDISDKSFHVVSINTLWLPRLVVSSHIDCDHPMCLLEMSNLVPPGKPELGESMKEEKEGFVGVSRLNVVQLHTIHSHIVMHTKVRIHQAFWGETPSLDPKNAAAEDDEPDCEADEDSRDGEEEAKEGAQGSTPVNLHPN